MIPAVAATLTAVARRMRAATRPWWIIGSGAVALHGVPLDDVHDIDVIVDRAEAARVHAIFGVEPFTLAPDPLFRSAAFARWVGSALPVELIAGFEVAIDGGWWPVALRSRREMTLDGETLYVPDRAEMIALLRRIGRPKDLVRAAALEEREPG
ncbi:MAG: nucleotidyltransferase domain-containing protein [Sphingomonas sp.]